MPPLRLALAQLNVTVGDLDGNARRITEAIRRAQAWRADLVVVPELAVTGYPPEDLLLKPSFVTAAEHALQRVAPSAQGLVALVGCIERDAAGRLYNAVAVLANGRLRATYRKRYLPNYGVFDEKRYFTPGSEAVILILQGVRVGLTICEDLWEAAPCRELARAGAQLVINLSASPYHAGKRSVRQRLFSQRARTNGLAVASCNLVGGQDELVFDGASLILDAQGRLLAQGAQFREDLVVFDLDRQHLGRLRAGAVRRSMRTVSVDRPTTNRPRFAVTRRTPLNPVEEIYEALIVGLRDYVRKNGFSTVVLGLSGGVDSALTACLAADALGPERVVGVVMPSRFSSRATQADARALARRLGMAIREISIEPMFRAYLKTLQPFFGRRPRDVAEQNIQARIRGNLLMALSNKFGWLVLTTGNKSEFATGYCTLYGDMAGGLAVIKDVPKTLVYQLARFRNRRPAVVGAGGSEAPIPETVLRRAPTAELAPHQTDQDTLPPYPILDRILKAHVEEDRSLQEILSQDRSRAAMVRRVLRMVDHAEYKRRQGPPGIKITPKAFGRDRRMPITNRYDQTL